VRSRRTGEPYGQWAIHGGSVCYWHDGQLPPVKAAAARELATREAYRRAAQQTRDPATIAAVAAEALTRRAEETNDPGDYERASIRGEAGGRRCGRTGGGRGAGGDHTTIDDEVVVIANQIIEAERAKQEGS
jgi:hypothetical protein